MMTSEMTHAKIRGLLDFISAGLNSETGVLSAL